MTHFDGGAAVIGVLLIESNPTDAGMFGEWLSSATRPAFDIQRIPSFEQRLAPAGHADAILLGMPMIDVESLPRVSRMRNAAPAEPLIVLLGHAREAVLLEALRLGT